MSYEFMGVYKRIPVLLATQPVYAGYVASDVIRRGVPADDVRVTPFGVRVMTDDLDRVSSCRLFDRIYFTIPIKRGERLTAENACDTIAGSMLKRILDSYLAGERPIPCRIRVELPVTGNNKAKDRLRDDITRLTGVFSEALLQVLPMDIVPQAADYECELYFPGRPDGSFGMYLWMAAMKDDRFSYRKKVASTSMSPVRAAVMMEMLHPYFIEDDNILDPFCGIGTLLIERLKKSGAGNAFGVDISAQLVSSARENSKGSGEHIHFIQRDFFDFTYDGIIDEIITELPDLYHRNEANKIDFFDSFLKKCMEITSTGAQFFVLTGDCDIFASRIKKFSSLKPAERISFGAKREVFIIRRV